MNQKELNKVLELHKKWLNGKEGGVRADLRHANLSETDLYKTDLSNARLGSADLRKADLSYANLCKADLHYADLRKADLRGANWDFSVFPLWCGGSRFKTDVKLLKRLAAHMCTLECDDKEWLELKEKILPFAKKSHRASDLGLTKEV